MSNGSIALGVDGGASSLKIAIARDGGTPSFAEAPGANPNLIGMEEFLARLKDFISGELEAAGLDIKLVTSAGFGLSGIDRPDQKEQAERFVRTDLLPQCANTWVGNDALAALRIGAGELRGLVLIAGTGSICVGVDVNGEIRRSGGWGEAFGDEGSAFWIGREALSAASQMADGRRRKTELLDSILAHLHLDQPGDLIPWYGVQTREEFKRSAAEITPRVLGLWQAADPAADELIARAIEQLIELVDALADTGGEKLVCAGGLFSRSEPFYESFAGRIRKRLPAITPIRLVDPPSLGALQLGKEAAKLA